MVTDLAEMMCERLAAYEKKMKKLPERVFIFRDGVSEVSTFFLPPFSLFVTFIT